MSLVLLNGCAQIERNISSTKRSGFSQADLKTIAEAVGSKKSVLTYLKVKPSEEKALQEALLLQLTLDGILRADAESQVRPGTFARTHYFRVPLTGPEFLALSADKRVLGVSVALDDLERFNLKIGRTNSKKVANNLQDLINIVNPEENFQATVLLKEPWAKVPEETKARLKVNSGGMTIIDMGGGGTYLLVSVLDLSYLDAEDVVISIGAP